MKNIYALSTGWTLKNHQDVRQTGPVNFYIYIYIYICTIMKTMCPLGYHHNGYSHIAGTNEPKSA